MKLSFAFFFACSAASTIISSQATHPRVQTVYQFPNDTRLENVATRRNGGILFCANIASQGLFHVDPSSTKRDALRVAEFEGNVTTGITEVFPDVFAVNNGDLDYETFAPTPGTWAVYLVDVRKLDSVSGKGAIVSKVTDVPEAGILNGATTLSQHDGTILVADSAYGKVWKVNVKTGARSISFDDPLLRPGNNTPAGVNGLKYRGGKLFFSNTFQSGGFLGSVRVTAQGKAVGTVDILARNMLIDDFALDEQLNVYMANTDKNTVSKVTPGKQVSVVAGAPQSNEIPGPTATFFSQVDPRILYVSTNGGKLVSLTF